MITLEDCIAFCGLTEEVLAIAEHEHRPEIVACALAKSLLNQEHGPETIRGMIVDDVRAAQARGDAKHVLDPAARAASFPQGSSSGAAAAMGPCGLRRRKAMRCEQCRRLSWLRAKSQPQPQPERNHRTSVTIPYTSLRLSCIGATWLCSCRAGGGKELRPSGSRSHAP
jgi:hypothetical protein